MGRIKSLMVKKAAKQLHASNVEFTSEFETNKKILGNNMPSKSTRNKIAGYIARIDRMKKAELAKQEAQSKGTKEPTTSA